MECKPHTNYENPKKETPSSVGLSNPVCPPTHAGLQCLPRAGRRRGRGREEERGLAPVDDAASLLSTGRIRSRQRSLSPTPSELRLAEERIPTPGTGHTGSHRPPAECSGAEQPRQPTLPERLLQDFSKLPPTSSSLLPRLGKKQSIRFHPYFRNTSCVLGESRM